ncbi:hypothetical protein FKM82_017017 [Ascaphus truei]
MQAILKVCYFISTDASFTTPVKHRLAQTAGRGTLNPSPQSPVKTYYPCNAGAPGPSNNEWYHSVQRQILWHYICILI